MAGFLRVGEEKTQHDASSSCEDFDDADAEKTAKPEG